MDMAQKLTNAVYAGFVGHQMTCPVTGAVLDFRTAVVVENVETDRVIMVLSPEAWEQRAGNLTADQRSKIRLVINGKVA